MRAGSVSRRGGADLVPHLSHVEELDRYMQVVGDWLVTLAAAVAFVLAFEAEVAKPYRIPSSSMEGTLHCARPEAGCLASSSDRVLVNRLAYVFGSPQRG